MMTTNEFDAIANLVRERSGMVLDADKLYLVESRVENVRKEFALSDIPELVRLMRSSQFHPVNDAIVDALTVNETAFFRDGTPFDALKADVLPALIRNRSDKKTLRIWCAAASSGQEPYSVCMVLREAFPDVAQDWRVEFVASDISDQMLARCREGVYSDVEVGRGISPDLKSRYFERDGDAWRIRPEIRRMVDFRKVNLHEGWPFSGRFDLIFIRNVLIYFDVAAKQKIFDRLMKVLEPDGFLYLGAAESTVGLKADLRRASVPRSGVYQLGGQASPR